MALVVNGVRLASGSPMRVAGAYIGTVGQGNWGRHRRNWYVGEATQNVSAQASSTPSGYVAPVAWALAPVAGGMASRSELEGDGDVSSANLAGGLNGESSMAGAGDLTAAGGLVVSAVAAIVGAGDLDADVSGALALSSSLSGAGDIAGAIGALASAVAAITGDGALSGSATAKAAMSATITSEGELLTTANVAAAVWDALAASFVGAGTMGEALNTAGSGGLSPTQSTMLLEVYRVLGLDPTLPLVVTATSRRVPEDGSEIDQTIDEDAGTVTVTRT